MTEAKHQDHLACEPLLKTGDIPSSVLVKEEGKAVVVVQEEEEKIESGEKIVVTISPDTPLLFHHATSSVVSSTVASGAAIKKPTTASCTSSIASSKNDCFLNSYYNETEKGSLNGNNRKATSKLDSKSNPFYAYQSDSVERSDEEHKDSDSTRNEATLPVEIDDQDEDDDVSFTSSSSEDEDNPLMMEGSSSSSSSSRSSKGEKAPRRKSKSFLPSPKRLSATKTIKPEDIAAAALIPMASPTPTPQQKKKIREIDDDFDVDDFDDVMKNCWGLKIEKGRSWPGIMKNHDDQRRSLTNHDNDNEQITGSNSWDMKDENEADDQPTGLSPFLMKATVSMPALSTPIGELLHQPFHGRRPSVIVEESSTHEADEAVSQKYSGMEVLQRITSQQEFPMSSHNLHTLHEKHREVEEHGDATTTAAGTNLLKPSLSSPLFTTPESMTKNLTPSRFSSVPASPQSPPRTERTGTNSSFIISSLPPSPTSSILNGTTANGAAIDESDDFVPYYSVTRLFDFISKYILKKHYSPVAAATWIGFWALLHVTCANHILMPMRDAIALQVGVQHMPKLTLASTVLAVFSSVPIGWLFEAPDPSRRLLWKRMGLTRGETQGTSLALFYRLFALVLVSYAIGFSGIEFLRKYYSSSSYDVYDDDILHDNTSTEQVPAVLETVVTTSSKQWWWPSTMIDMVSIWSAIAQFLYILFFLVVHLMKLHCLSLLWGVTTEAMEYEEESRKKQGKNHGADGTSPEGDSNQMRIRRLALIGFGGTSGGILGSVLASSLAHLLKLPGLLLLAACLLEVAAELSIELGRIMQKHWIKQQLEYLKQLEEEKENKHKIPEKLDSASTLDSSLKRSVSLGSMKRVASGNSLNRVKSTSDLSHRAKSTNNLAGMAANQKENTQQSQQDTDELNDDTFTQRLLRGAKTIFRSRLLMAIFTYNALYASTNVLLSFQRAALVANRNNNTTVQGDTAFLANINMASSIAIFALQASGAGAYVAHNCGPRGTLSLMPMIRLAGVLSLAWWHQMSRGQPPNLLVFLVVDECCKIMNLAVAKPVRESLWRGLSNEARYEAKPIVDTLANRWGGGSAAFLVSFVDRTLDLFGVIAHNEDGSRNVFGFPPILFLCIIISAWWAVVSADLGTIRKNIDLELKKRQ